MERNNENKIFVGNLNYEVDSDDLNKKPPLLIRT